jgi:hypothetical protein
LPSLIYFSWDIYRKPPSTKQISNIKVDIWHSTVGLRCRNQPRHLSQLKAREIPLTYTPSSPSQQQSVKYQVWYLNFVLWRGVGVSINISWKIFQGRQSSCPLGVSVKDIARVFSWFKCLGGFLHLKPTVGCQISTLIFDFFLWRGGSL